MILFGFAFRNDDFWKGLSIYTWVTVALAFPAFWLKGAAFYVFMLAILSWSEVVAIRLYSTTFIDFTSNILYSIIINFLGVTRWQTRKKQVHRDG
jgi:hypothetical protein